MKSDGVLILKQSSILQEETLFMNAYKIEIMDEIELKIMKFRVFSECSADFKSNFRAEIHGPPARDQSV